MCLSVMVSILTLSLSVRASGGWSMILTCSGIAGDVLRCGMCASARVDQDGEAGGKHRGVDSEAEFLRVVNGMVIRPQVYVCRRVYYSQ